MDKKRQREIHGSGEKITEKGVLEQLKKHYDLDENREEIVMGLVFLRLMYLNRALKSEKTDSRDFKDLKGKKNLDLGCGSFNNPDEGGPWGSPRKYEPWFCRALQIIGAKPEGVDNHTEGLDKENFEHHHLDLTKRDALKDIPSDSFDAVTSSLLTDNASTNLIKQLGKDGKMSTLKEMEEELKKQATRILREEGVFMEGIKIYRKNGGVLKEE